MRPFDQQSRDGFLGMEDNRLETPSMAGYRAGMSSSGVIGRRLGSVYGVDDDLPSEMNRAIRNLHDRFGTRR